MKLSCCVTSSGIPFLLVSSVCAKQEQSLEAQCNRTDLGALRQSCSSLCFQAAREVRLEWDPGTSLVPDPRPHPYCLKICSLPFLVVLGELVLSAPRHSGLSLAVCIDATQAERGQSFVAHSTECLW